MNEEVNGIVVVVVVVVLVVVVGLRRVNKGLHIYFIVLWHSNAKSGTWTRVFHRYIANSHHRERIRRPDHERVHE